MTNKEAIKYLKQLKYDYNPLCPQREALRLAIRALEERPKGASNYSEGWMDGYNHAIDQIFEELNYLLKNHVIEELRKRIKR